MTIPAGLKVSRVSYGSKGKYIYFVEDFPKLFGRNSIEYHDAEYYGISVDAADITKLDEHEMLIAQDGWETDDERARR